jgi:hypothetical protein
MKRCPLPRGQPIVPVIVVAALLGSDATALAADPTTADCLSANDNAIALRRDHKLRAARAQLLVCSAASCPADVRTECIRRVAEINIAMPTIVFEAKDAAGNDIGAVKVAMDGQPLAERLEGTAISLDPGEHSFAFESAGQRVIQRQFVIREGEKERRERITFGPDSARQSPEVAPASGSPPPGPRDEAPPPSGDSTKRTVGFVVGGLGVGALGLALYEQIVALGRASDSNNAAASPDPNVQATAKPIHDQAVQAQTYAIVSALGGAAAVGAAAYMIATSFGSAPRAAVSRWMVSPQIGKVSGVTLEGSW